MFADYSTRACVINCPNDANNTFADSSTRTCVRRTLFVIQDVPTCLLKPSMITQPNAVSPPALLDLPTVLVNSVWQSVPTTITDRHPHTHASRCALFSFLLFLQKMPQGCVLQPVMQHSSCTLTPTQVDVSKVIFH